VDIITYDKFDIDELRDIDCVCVGRMGQSHWLLCTLCLWAGRPLAVNTGPRNCAARDYLPCGSTCLSVCLSAAWRILKLVDHARACELWLCVCVCVCVKVEPFCEPWLFNPWGQCNLGQAQIFIGLLLLNSVHGTYQYPWQNTGAAVWAGIIVRPSLSLSLSLSASLQSHLSSVDVCCVEMIDW